MSTYRTLFTLTLLFSPVCLHAQAVTDGTMGAVQTLSGQFTVPASLGKMSGNNLFHSFKSFSINSGESATFTGPENVLNVISRVTGGDVSTINGVLRSQVGNANFYLINPAGVVFGRDASIDVPAAFHVGAVETLRFVDGTLYSGATPASSLSLSAPERFGLMNTSLANNGLLSVHGAALRVPDQQMLDLAAQKIIIDNQAQLTAKEGAMTLTGGEIAVSASTLTTDTTTAGNAGNLDIAANTLTLTDGATLSASSYSAGQGGAVHIQAGNILLDGNNQDAFTGVVANAYDSGKAGTVTVDATSLTLQGGAQMNSSTFGAGDANAVTVNAQTVTLNGKGNTYGATGIGSSANAGSRGQARNIALTADTLTLLNGGTIRSATFSTGNAGTVDVTAHNLHIDGQNNRLTPTGIDSSTSASATGNAGQITVKADNLSIYNAGTIGSNSFGQGNGGAVQVQADKIDINGQGSDAAAFTGISSTTYSAGQAGSVKVVASELNLFQSGRIASNTVGEGNAGDVNVVADTVHIDGNNSDIYTGIASNTYEGSQGNAGTVHINALHLTIDNAGRITSNTRGTGKAGNLMVEAETIDIDAKNSPYLAGISSAASPDSTGQVGNVYIVAGHHLRLANQAQVSIQNRGSVPDGAAMAFGEIAITTPSLRLVNQSLINAQATQNANASAIALHIGQFLTLQGSSISTQANSGNGGSIAIDSGHYIAMQQSSITTSVASSIGNGGNITVSTPALVLDNGMVQANAYSGHGGEVFIDVDSLLGSQNRLIQGGDVPLIWKNSVPGFNIIQAASKFGLSGTVNVTSPQLDLSGVLIGLGTASFGRDVLSQDYCATGVGSSMTVRGFGVLPLSASDVLY